MNYHIEWKIPEQAIDQKEQRARSGSLLQMVEKAIASGEITEFGMYPGTTEGFLIFKNGGISVSKFCNRFRPFIDITDAKQIIEASEMRKLVEP